MRGFLDTRVTKLLMFRGGFLKKEIQLARDGVGVQFPVPKRVVTLAEPSCDAGEFLGSQAFDCTFEFFDPVHIGSLYQLAEIHVPLILIAAC